MTMKINMISKETLEHTVTTALKDYGDMEIILLKGHLVLEQLLNQLIHAHQLDAKRIDSMNLMFSKTLELAMAIDGRLLKDKYPHLKEINRIRNKVSHELFFSEFHDDLKKWSSDVLGYTPKTINTKRTYKNHVIKAFSLLAGILTGTCDAVEAIKGSSNNVLAGIQ